MNDHKAIRFFQVARDLRQELVRCHSDRGDERQFRADILFDLLANRHRGTAERLATGDVKKGFVEREWFNQWRIALHHRADLFGHLCVEFHPWSQKDGLWATAFGFRSGHRTVDTRLARRIVGRCHHSSPCRRPAHNDRLTCQFRPITLFDRSVKGVHVNMEDHRDAPTAA